MMNVCAVVLCLVLVLAAGPAMAELKAGVSRVSITPLEEGLPTQLGGYGEREGKPAEGIHDTIWAKTLVFEWNGKKSALVTLDVCSVPSGVVTDSLAKAGVEGLTPETVLMVASHTHAGIEGFSMDRRNIANNKNIGIFDEKVLEFVTTRLAQGIREAAGKLEPVTAGAASVELPNMNRNRRGKDVIDRELTVLRLDRADGSPFAVLVNFTAHGTIMTEKEMLISGGWPGNMQRTVEALMGQDVTCMYTNGAEGDISPGRRVGGSRWEQAEDFGRHVGIEVNKLAAGINTKPVETFALTVRMVDLPPHQIPPGFVEITGEEYNVTLEQIQQILPIMFPSQAPVCALRVDDFEMVTFPGEPVCSIGLTVKKAVAEAGIEYPCVAALTNELVGYILTKEDYQRGGYEVTTSFYGEALGELLCGEATKLGVDVASRK